MNTLKPEKQKMVISLLVEGNSIRSTERITGVHRDTIMRLLVRAGERCEHIMEREIDGMYTSSVQCDELWTFVHTKEKRVKPYDPPEWGDAYTFIGLERESKVILATHVGKRNDVATDRFIETLSRRVGGEVQIFTDGWAAYRVAIPRHFGRRANFMQIVKHFDGETEESHRYSPPRITSITHRWVTGSPRTGLMTTSHVERSNWSVRTYLRRFTRLSNGFSRKLDNLRAAVSLYATWYNWCKNHTALGTTPACAAGLAASAWPIDQLLP